MEELALEELRLVEGRNDYIIGGARFPKRDGWDYDNAFGAKDGNMPLVFVLRDRVVLWGVRGQHYYWGVMWTGKGFVDCKYFPATDSYSVRDGLIESGGYDEADESMLYAEDWEEVDLKTAVFGK